jgi:hypothetical protein
MIKLIRIFLKKFGSVRFCKPEIKKKRTEPV